MNRTLLVRVKSEGCDMQTFEVEGAAFLSEDMQCLAALGTLFREGYCAGDAYQIVLMSDNVEKILEGSDFDIDDE